MKPSIEYLREAFDYDPESGILKWKFRPKHHFNTKFSRSRCNSVYAGNEAGCIHFNPKGGKYYRRIHVHGHSIFAHHIAWVIKTGEWPVSIDHEDGNGLNNKWVNIRKADNQENMKNLKRYKNNKTGRTGVYPYGNRWTTSIRISGKLKFIGTFDDFRDAVAAREAAEKKYNFHVNHGADRPL